MNTPTFEWLDDNLEPYCPGKDVCQRACDETCPIYVNSFGCMLLEEGKKEKAMEVFKVAIDLTPDWRYYAAWCNLGTVYNCLGCTKDAFEAFMNAYSINQDNARVYEGLAASYANFKDYDKALEWCDMYAKRFGEEGIAKLRGKIVGAMSRER